MIDRREIIEVSQVHTETKKILRVVYRIGGASNLNMLTGIDCFDIAKQIEEYALFINEHRSHYNEFFQNTAKAL